MKKAFVCALSVATVTTAALAGCSSATSGTATSGTSSNVAAPPPAAVPSDLNVGTYPTTPRVIPPNSSDGAWVEEGNRMGEALIQGNEVDPRMVIGGAALRSFPVLSGIELSNRVPDGTATVFEANDMQVGMTTTRGDKLTDPTVAVRIGLYRFKTDAAATSAVSAIRAATAARQQVTVPGTPGVVASVFKPGTVDSYLAQGPIVINVSGTGPTDAEATGFVSKAFSLEVPKLKTFTPTPVADVPKLPSDSDGILARTLPLSNPTDGGVPELMTGYYGLAGLLHRIPTLATAGKYEQAGVDLVGQADGVVYRTRDAAAATTLLTAMYSAPGDIHAASAPDVPAMKCVRDAVGSSVRCGVTVGRYVADLTGDSLDVAQQKASAEFAILTKAGS
ncbi:DUF7373 family lipoprotein [Tsukamurella soli]|uniref:DUF7373 family lipoprotein n=1 Tax=Tsukamurella soli TaxID=644556 RepID=UPI0031EF4B57